MLTNALFSLAGTPQQTHGMYLCIYNSSISDVWSEEILTSRPPEKLAATCQSVWPRLETRYFILTSKNSGCIVTEWIPSLCRKCLIVSAALIYLSTFFACTWRDAMTLLPAKLQTWNSCMLRTPSIYNT